MAINFPINPSNGDTYVVGEVTFTYNATKSIWSSEIITDPISLSLSLSDITNVSSTSPTAGQVLSYDVTNTEWINTTPIDAYTKTEVDTAIGNVSVDLSGYDTSAQVDTKIASIPDTDLSAYDTSAQVDTKVASIVDSAPETLDTLNELAAALGDDANHVTTMTTLVGTKADQSTTYTKTEVDTSLNLKSDKTTTYTKTEVDTSLNLKSDKTTTYTKTEVDSAVLSNWTEDANGHILPNVNNTHDIGSSTLKVRDIYMSGSTIHLGNQSISADADGIKMPAIKIGTGANVISLSASSDGKLVQTATVGGVVQTPTTSTGASVIVSDTPPSSPSSGDLWTDSTTMKMFIYYEDDDSSQWVGVSGSSGADGDIGPAGPVGPSGGLSVYLTPLDLPTTGSTGDQAYVESNTSLYIYDENITGWYRVALINQTPTFTSTPDASYVFATDGTPLVVTPVAVDPEGSLVTYSVIGDMGTVATMTQDDNAFTFTPSTDESNAGSFSITFRATDGVNVADAISNFTLSFIFAVSLENPSNITNHGAGYEVQGSCLPGDAPWSLTAHIKGALVLNSPQYGICTFVETINTTTFDDMFYIEMHFSSNAYWGGIGIIEVNSYNNNPSQSVGGAGALWISYVHFDNQVNNSKVSILWDVPNGTIKFFHNGTLSPEHYNGVNLISTVVPGEYYIVLVDAASAGSVAGAYIVTNPDYWTYDPEVLDQL